MQAKKIIFGPSILRCSARQCNRNLECSARRCNRNLESAKGASETRQLAIFPLATTTVGWVPDRTPAGPKRSGGLEAQRRVVRAGCRLRMQLRGNNIGLVTLIINFDRRVVDPIRIVCSPDRTDGFSVSGRWSHCRIFHQLHRRLRCAPYTWAMSLLALLVQ